MLQVTPGQDIFRVRTFDHAQRTGDVIGRGLLLEIGRYTHTAAATLWAYVDLRMLGDTVGMEGTRNFHEAAPGCD